MQTEKSKLGRRVSKLVHNGKQSFDILEESKCSFCLEKDLLQELQKCRRTTKPSTASASGGSLAKKPSFSTRLDIHFKNIEDERDMYKNEVEILQKLLHDRSRNVSPSRLRGRSVSPTTATRLANRPSPVIPFVKRSASSCSTSPTRCTVCGLNRNRSSPTRVRCK